MRENFICLRLIRRDAINCILHKISIWDRSRKIWNRHRISVRKNESIRPNSVSVPEPSLGSRHLLFPTDIVLWSSFKFVFAVLAAEVVRRPFMRHPVFGRTVVDLHATHRVDSHSELLGMLGLLTFR